MPVYEYECEGCGKRFQELVGMTADSATATCPRCGSAQAKRLMSRFARVRSEDARIDDLADRLDTMDDPDSPTAMREMMREMGKALDDDASDEMEEMFEADMEEGGGDDEA